VVANSADQYEYVSMSDTLSPGKRMSAAIDLRDAALELLKREGKPRQTIEGDVVFEPHTAENPTPRLSLLLSKRLIHGHQTLNVWATLKGGHAKVLNIEWLGGKVAVVSFRRGEWEGELLAMGRTRRVAVH
jgi:hypothetical protein